VEKESLLKSSRFGVMLAGVILNVLILAAKDLGVDAEPEMLREVARWVSGLIIAFMGFRTFRNTPVSDKAAIERAPGGTVGAQPDVKN
jgi:hypothetical protein